MFYIYDQTGGNKPITSYNPTPNNCEPPVIKFELAKYGTSDYFEPSAGNPAWLDLTTDPTKIWIKTNDP